MYFSYLSAALLIGAASSVGATPQAGQHASRSALGELETLFGRQTVYCAPIEPPYTCERSCGPGYTECIAFPTCYDPSIGEICCSNGDYCDAGTYCTDGGCCDNGLTLEECDATVSLSVILPGASSTTAAASTTSAASATRTTSSTTKASTTSSSSNEGNGGAGQPLGGSTTSSTTKASTTTKASSTSPTTSSSSTSSSPVKQTAASAAGLRRDSPLENLVFGALGVLLLL